MSLGILGGTFNPIHRAHLRLAEAAGRALELRLVLFVPAGDPPLKHRDVAPARHRLEMVRLAVAEHADWQLSDLELRRNGPSYTVETLAEIARLYPDEERWFICGADALAELDAWHEPERLFEYTSFAVAQRPGVPHELHQLVPARIAAGFRRTQAEWVHALGGRLRVIPFPPLDVSATRIRDRISAGRSLADLVPEAVEEYIQRHSLYREAA